MIPSTKSIILRFLLAALLFGIMVFAYYLQTNFDASKVLDLFKSVLLIVFPLFFICELVINLIVYKKISEDYYINNKQYEILCFFDDLVSNNLLENYVFVNSYLHVREKTLDYINRHISKVYGNVSFLSDISDIISNKEDIIANYKKTGLKKHKIKAFFRKIESFDLREESSWIIKETKEYKTNALFDSNKYKGLEIFAISLSLLSLVFALCLPLHFSFTYFHIFYIVVPLAVEFVSLFVTPSKMVKLERSLLDDWLNNLYGLKKEYELRFEDAKKIKEYEDKIFDLKCKKKKVVLVKKVPVE